MGLKKKLTIIVLVVFFTVALPTVLRAASQEAVPASPVPLEVGIQGNNQAASMTDYIRMIYGFATAIVGGVAVVMIIVGAIQYATSAGNKAALGSAKETITSAIIGLVIVLLAYLILGTFSSSFVNLHNPTLDVIKTGEAGCMWTTPDNGQCPSGTKGGDASTCGDRPEGGGNFICCCAITEQLVCKPTSGGRGTCAKEHGYGVQQCSAEGVSCTPRTTHKECVDNGVGQFNVCQAVNGGGTGDLCQTDPKCSNCMTAGRVCKTKGWGSKLPCCNDLVCCGEETTGGFTTTYGSCQQACQ